MKHFRFSKTGCCIIALVVLALSLTGCFGGGGDSKSYTASGKVVDGNSDGIDGVKLVVTGVRTLQLPQQMAGNTY